MKKLVKWFVVLRPILLPIPIPVPAPIKPVVELVEK